jgi:branched-chain amino acid transport system permease protein
VLQFFAQHSKLVDQIGINALLALSLSISLRAGSLALAQAAFMGIAAYVSAIGAVNYGWNLPASAAAGALAAAVVAATASANFERPKRARARPQAASVP